MSFSECVFRCAGIKQPRVEGMTHQAVRTKIREPVREIKEWCSLLFLQQFRTTGHPDFNSPVSRTKNQHHAYSLPMPLTSCYLSRFSAVYILLHTTELSDCPAL